MNDDYIEYIVHPTEKLSIYWNDFFKKNPSLSAFAQSAREIISGENHKTQIFNDSEIKELKKRIINSCCITISN